MDLEEGLRITVHMLCSQKSSYEGFCASGFDFKTILMFALFASISRLEAAKGKLQGKGLLLEIVYIDDSKKRQGDKRVGGENPKKQI